ncbi:ubiquitin thioesterase OTU1 [Cladorrhinum sp. PSN259]|nr:ubiquitin thioesterase OTU1 [Cladorrhinum sp. PSN259]
MSLITIALRSPTGNLRIQILEESTLSDLLALIKEKTAIQNFTLKYGFPPKPLDTTSSPSSSIKPLNLKGETIIVAPADTSPPPPPAEPPKPSFTPKGIEPDETSLEWPERGGFLLLRVMPDDNSCMFTAFGGALGLENPSEVLRSQIAAYIMDHPQEYNKAILGDEPARYVSRILQPDVWGGAIELSILSDIYNIEISSIDVKSLRVDRFGEGKENRVVIVYSGIHYDRIAFAMDLSYPVEVDVSRWTTEDDEVLTKARELCKRLQGMHYYTDTTDFVIKCGVCGWIGQGTKDAGRHEKETGHREFGEMKIE